MGTEIYTVGGTVQANEQGLYIPRKADQELLQLCRDSTFAYVLTPRQMGKSSLMMRTAETLYEEGISAVIVDLTQIGTQLTSDQWYLGLLTTIADQLMLSVNVYQWWQARQHLGGTQRLSQFFEQVVISETTDPVVIFIDEIDTTLTLGFADDFYAAIRGLSVARAKQSELRRLSFVLIGVATPSDLIRDAKRTPFNVGERVELPDFTLSEALPMAVGLGLADNQAKQVLGWVLKWTGGHPYLTQRLCKTLVDEKKEDWQEDDVDEMVHHTFLGEESEKDNNLQFVRDMLTKRAPKGEGEAVLKTYREVQREKTSVKDEEQSLVKSHLKLAGVVRKEGEELKNRNLIYQTVFDKKWIQKHLPESIWQRLKPAMPLIAGLSVFSVAVSGLAVYAIDQSNKANNAEQLAEQKTRETEIALEQSRQNETAAEAAAREAQRQKKLAQKSASLARHRLHQMNLARKAEVLEREKVERAKKLAENRQVEAVVQKNIALKQRNLADKRRKQANHATEREKKQKLIAQNEKHRAEIQSKLAQLREKTASVSYWLSSTNPSLGLVIAIETMDQAHNVLKYRNVAQFSLLSAIQNVQEINSIIGLFRPVHSVAFSIDGEKIVSGNSEGILQLWDSQNGKPIGTPVSGHQRQINSVAFSYDGKKFVSGSSDGTIRLWDTKSGQPISKPLNGRQGQVNSVAFSHDSAFILSGGTSGTIRLWDTQSGQEIGKPLNGHQGPVYKVLFTSDDRRIVSSGWDGLRLWDWRVKQRINNIDNAKQVFHQRLEAVTSPFNDIDISHDDTHIITGAEDGSLQLWDSWSGKPIGESLKGHLAPINSIKFNHDSTYVISGAEDGTIRLWDILNAKPVGETFTGHQGPVMSVAFSPNDTRIVSGGEDGTIRLWNSRQLIGKSFKTQEGSISTADFNKNNLEIVSGSSNGTLRLWNALNGQPIGKPLQGHTNSINSVAISNNGERIISGGDDGTLRLWNALNGQPIGKPLQGHKGPIYSVALSSDGSRVLSGSWDGSLRLWGVQNRLQISESFQGHTDIVWSVIFNSDSTLGISGSEDGTIRLWDTQSGQEIGKPLRGHQGPVLSVAISSNNTRIVSGGEDGTIRLWDTQSGQEIGKPLRGHQGPVTSVIFGADDEHIISVSDDGTMQYWDLRPNKLIDLACLKLKDHQLLYQPEKVTTKRELINSAKRTRAICQRQLGLHSYYFDKSTKTLFNTISKSIRMILSEKKI